MKGISSRKRTCRPDAVTIGVLGAGAGCGVTHFSVLFANYLTAVELKKTAVLGRSGRSDLEKLTAVCDGVRQEKWPARILGVDYFPRSGSGELTACMQGGYEAILLDLGNLKDGKTAEFLQCRIKCFLGALNEWKIQELTEQKEWLLTGQGSWNFLTVFGSEEARKEMKRRYSLCFEAVPFAPDAFQIDYAAAVLLKKIWSRQG